MSRIYISIGDISVRPSSNVSDPTPVKAKIIQEIQDFLKNSPLVSSVKPSKSKAFTVGAMLTKYEIAGGVATCWIVPTIKDGGDTIRSKVRGTAELKVKEGDTTSLSLALEKAVQKMMEEVVLDLTAPPLSPEEAKLIYVAQATVSPSAGSAALPTGIEKAVNAALRSIVVKNPKLTQDPDEASIGKGYKRLMKGISFKLKIKLTLSQGNAKSGEVHISGEASNYPSGDLIPLGSGGAKSTFQGSSPESVIVDAARDWLKDALKIVPSSSYFN